MVCAKKATAVVLVVMEGESENVVGDCDRRQGCTCSVGLGPGATRAGPELTHGGADLTINRSWARVPALCVLPLFRPDRRMNSD
ncbi:unnamed protein product [Boreogadus saida]